MGAFGRCYELANGTGFEAVDKNEVAVGRERVVVDMWWGVVDIEREAAYIGLVGVGLKHSH